MAKTYRNENFDGGFREPKKKKEPKFLNETRFEDDDDDDDDELFEWQSSPIRFNKVNRIKARN